MEVSEYRRLDRPAPDLSGILLGGPKLDDSAAEVFAEIEAERKADLGRAADLELAREMRGSHGRDLKDPDGGQPEDHQSGL
jgi:hypothetical protein